jgi:type III secretion protein J
MVLRLVLTIVLTFGVIGCTDESLYSGLTEREANEIIALLSNAGIRATKTRNGDESFTVSTSRERFSQAIELLKTNGYPKNRFESLGDVFKKEGFVSSPLEEKARLNYAQSQELSRTIESIDGVILARVHLAIPKDNQLQSKTKPSSASVFIKHRRGIDLTDRESQIKALIVNSIEGLPYENVTVAMFSSNPVPITPSENTDYESFVSSLSSMELDYLIISLSIVALILLILSVSLYLKNKKHSTHLRITNSDT